MENKTIYDTADRLARQLQAIDYDSLNISDYNKQYIRRLRPALRYYMRIYASCLDQGLKAAGLRDGSALTLVDYGGGSGFLSLLAKAAGTGEVVYLDLNPKSAHTIRTLKSLLGFGPDTILEGSSDTLAAWCRQEGKRPQLLIATDLIEHVYDLRPFFADLAGLNERLVMLFTTASTPFNPFVKRRLHRLMAGCEKGTLESPNYYTLRLGYIREQYPKASEEETARWAELTRGLTYEDIRKAIDTNCFPAQTDAYNTCDPRSGNWTERILPIRAYRDLAEPLGYSVRIGKGFYNPYRRNKLFSLVCRLLNGAIRLGGAAGYLLAPFIHIEMKKKR